MKFDLEPRYSNYWLDLARKEEKERQAKEEAKRLDALANVVILIGQNPKAKS